MNFLKTTFLMGLLMGLMLWVGDLVGGRHGLYMALLFGGFFNVLMYWFSDKVVLWQSGAREASEEEVPQVYRVVRNLSQQARIPMPKIYVVDRMEPNAFATGRSPSHAAVAVNRGLLNILDERELTGVLGHELSHVIHRDVLISTIAVVMAGAISMLARMAHYGLLFGGYGRRDDDRERGGHPIVMILTVLLAPVAAMLIQLAITRTREFDADRGGASLTGDPMALASALRKIERYVRGDAYASAGMSPALASLYIVNPLSAEGFKRLFSTHPSTEERCERLEAMLTGSGRR